MLKDQDIKSRISLISPATISETIDPSDETPEQTSERNKKFFSLSIKKRFKLASAEISEKIQSIGDKYELDLRRLANITLLIRNYYFGEVKLENFPKEIERGLGVSLFTAQEIARYIKVEILDWDPAVDYLGKMPKITLREIVKNYPEIAEQEITRREIELTGNEKWAYPTIANWIHDYTQHLGQGQHSAIDRMNYLFHSENTSRLTSPEREKLGIILKSLDENLPLPIDEENKEIPLDYLIPESQISRSIEHGTLNIRKSQTQSTPTESYIPSIQPKLITPASKPVQLKPAPPKQKFVKSYLQINSTSNPSSQTKEPPASTPPFAKPRDSKHLDFSNSYSQSETHSTLQSFPSSPASSFFKSEPNVNILPVGNSYPLDNIPESDTISTKSQPDEPRTPVRPKLPNLEEPPRRASVINFFQTPEKFGNSPVEIKGFTEHQTPKNVSPSQPAINTPANPAAAKVAAPEETKKSFSSYTFIPPPHNIIHPHMYDSAKKEKSEPKLNGNIVDLSKL